MGRFLCSAGLHTDIPCEVTAIGKGCKCPDSGRNHAETPALEQIPVAHAAHLLLVRLYIRLRHLIDHHFRRCQVFRGIDGKSGLIFI